MWIKKRLNPAHGDLPPPHVSGYGAESMSDNAHCEFFPESENYRAQKRIEQKEIEKRH
jgi:hypothetical protein